MDGVLPEKIKKRKDKYPYSPGHYNIIQRDIVKIKSLLADKKLNAQMENMVDNTKMISQLEKLVESKTSRNFNNEYWGILSLSMWIAFSNWLQNKTNKCTLQFFDGTCRWT